MEESPDSRRRRLGRERKRQQRLKNIDRKVCIKCSSRPATSGKDQKYCETCHHSRRRVANSGSIAATDHADQNQLSNERRPIEELLQELEAVPVAPLIPPLNRAVIGAPTTLLTQPPLMPIIRSQPTNLEPDSDVEEIQQIQWRISRYYRTRKISEYDLERELFRDPCAICKDTSVLNDVIAVTHCFHIFHESCLRPWLMIRESCPSCRMSFLEAAHLERQLLTIQLDEEVSVVQAGSFFGPQ
eukprot:GILJ01007741.1.p1 GENE.GILJ01007741.1~~GILJ01007741.1.p1  ORF type:complete len:243 (-),score=15.50 GILJ01007741.1:100-828(-)